MKMAVRLADYFVVVGFDHCKERSGGSQGIVEQRYPVTDWPDVPFIQGIETFCQPQGWSLATQPLKPSFFVAVLTDITGTRHNAAMFAFTEPVALEKQHERHSLTYAPRCLVLVARHAHINILRQCLGLIYTAHVDRLQAPLETLVGNVLGAITIPPPGSPPLRFSLGAGDLQVIEPRKFAAVPVTGTSVYSLFSQLSAHNVVQLLCAAMAEFKIVLFSQSHLRLQQSCHAVISLMYPFQYTHVYIPLLPSALIEVLNTPTPFIMGCHASLRDEIHDIYDVMMVDLDSGSLDVPQCVRIPALPDTLLQRLHADLCSALQPELLTADDAFPSDAPSCGNGPTNSGRDRSSGGREDPAALDKRIRAIFLRMFAQMLQGYRCCLTVVRVHPKPLVVFDRAAFLSRREVAKNKSEFVEKLLESMFFQQFVVARGPPYRACDLFDEVYVEMQQLIKSREQHIHDIGKLLYENEHHGSQLLQRVPQPTQGAFTRIHQPPFPRLVDQQITAIIEQNMASGKTSTNAGSGKGGEALRIVPNAGLAGRSASGAAVERKLDVLRQCVRCILAERNLAEARKCLPGVLRAFESPLARAALAYELRRHVGGTHRVELEMGQFDLIVRLMNAALQDDPHTHVDNTIGIAILLLPLTQIFCRRLAQNVVQFAYTCLQEHAVWASPEFWQAAFHQDVERNIVALYQESNEFPATALELCATQMKLAQGNNTDKFQIDTCAQREEQTVYSQAVEYIYLVTCIRIPPDLRSSRGGHGVGGSDKQNAGGSESNSMCDTDSIDGEGSFAMPEDDSFPALRQSVIKFISRFIDKVCTDAGVTPEHMRQLHSMIPQRVDMQLDEMRSVNRESQRLPPVLKAKILQPCLLPGETVCVGVRAYLIPDGRQEDLVMPLIPAEGALFVTNYRIVFKGTPIDPYLCEHTVIRAFPIASLSKDKKFTLPKGI
ncbi:myotubularin-related protein 13-like [Tropilaelaps mercedesae]|uniref:Myotubularin-related protein 13-like n=1 Tax=Tropilaelaps mercedesae TaxID=418985 RepID=A0A1V9XBH4_9ACAR|nr:myotubularin-related protein 13-like [Tropilaelaps mercedesae]